MAMTASVKDELSRLAVTKPCCRKAEVSSMLRFAEDSLGLATMTNRDRGANNMMGSFDFQQSPRPPFLLQQRSCPSGKPYENGDYDD